MKRSSLNQRELRRCAAPAGEAHAIWLTRKQLASRYQVSVRCVDYWVEANRVPVYRVGRVVRFNPGECDQALGTYRIPARVCKN